MKQLSELTDGEIGRLSEAEVEAILKTPEDNGEHYDVLLVLGGRPERMNERVAKASELWNAGRVDYICVTGGVLWQTAYGIISEAENMKRLLLKNGVPKARILVEDRAENTRENYIFSLETIEKALGVLSVKSVLALTSRFHVRRSLVYARSFLPRYMQVSVIGAPFGEGGRERELELMRKEIRLLKDLMIRYDFPESYLLEDR